MSVDVLALIAAKRDGSIHTPAQIRAFIEAFMSGTVPDYQMSAWLMAAYLRGLSEAETDALTQAMLHSGDVLELASVTRPRIDKHSTGGVGDKISLTVGPAAAACGLAVPMISGRSLGHTGGTLDKLEAIPGYRTHLDAGEFERIVAEVGVSMVGATERVAPADARIYALRDVTGTVASIPLIVASILSKKLAEGIDGIVFDVKVGRGAFMKTLDEARRLADALTGAAARAGKSASALLTDMSHPIGDYVGNALEVKEAIEVLRGGGPADTVDLTVRLGAEMLALGGIGESEDDREHRVRTALRDGRALDVFRKMIAAHGGDERVVDDGRRLPQAAHRVPVFSTRAGIVQGIDALALGLLGVSMGAGRVRADAPVDPAVGIELARKPGDAVAIGEPLAWLHVREKDIPPEWSASLGASFAIGSQDVPRSGRVLERRGAKTAEPIS
jgi:pyrimidine-nucleoside phosphorylase